MSRIQWNDDQALFSWRDAIGKETPAPFTLRDATEGVHIFGGKGSGKTSGSLATLAKAYLRAGMGGLVLTSKPEETTLWRNYANETHRSGDLKVLSARKENVDWKFNFLDAEAKRDASGAMVENIVQLLMTMIEFSGTGSGGVSDQPYWELATRDLLRNAVTLSLHTSQRLQLADLKDIVTAPLCPQGRDDDAEVQEWQATDAAQRLTVLREKAQSETSEGRLADLLDTIHYWTVLFPNLPEETRRTITTYFTGLVAAFLRHPFRDLFCSETTVHPRQTWEEGAVIVLDLPVLEYHESGKLAQAVFKYMFQREAQAHDVKRFPRPVFLFEDEKQLFLTRHDFLFDSISRSFRVCSVAATQSLSQYHAVLSRHGGEAQAESFLGNYQTQIFHANTNAKTNLWASETIGRTRIFRGSATLDPKHQSRSIFGGSSMGSHTIHEQYDYRVQPSEFIGLGRGGAAYQHRVEAFVLKSGKPFQTNQKHQEKNHLKTVFLQTMHNDHDEHLKKLEPSQQKWNHINERWERFLGVMIGRCIRLFAIGAFQKGGVFMEIFLRHNFGVRYFPTGFALLTTASLGWGLFYSVCALLFTPVLDPGDMFWALSLFASSLLFTIPWTIHGISILRRWSNTSGIHSEHPGDAWLDCINRWAQKMPRLSQTWQARALDWMCGDELRRDFIGETVLGVGIAYVAGWICFSSYVTNFLLGSLVLMQVKRAKVNFQAVRERRDRNDAELGMEKRRQESERGE